MGETLEQNFFLQLDENDQQKIQYFVQLLLRQSKYNKLKDELTKRRKEIAEGVVLTHSEIWNGMDA